MARFAIDAHTLAETGGGNRSYVLGLLEGLAALSWPGEIVLYTLPERRKGGIRRKETSSARGSRAVTHPLQEPHGGGCDPRLPGVRTELLHGVGPLRRLGIELPRRLAHDHVSAAIFQYIGPLFAPCPIVLAIHDPSFLVAPRWLGWSLSARIRLTTVPALRRASAVLTPSHWTAEVLRRHVPSVAGCLHVLPLGVSHRFRQRADGNDEQVRQALGLPPRYLLYLGRRQRRKNLGMLVQAYLEAAGARPDVPPLVLLGPAGDTDKPLHTTVRAAGLDDRVLFRDAVGDDELAAVYRGAELLCFPGRYEGFGLPLVEAMACGCPVIASAEGALPETVGDAGVLLSPEDVSAWARSIVDLCGDAPRREHLRERGLARADRFSWPACAAATVSILQQVSAA